MNRVIILMDNWLLGVRAAKWLKDRPEQKDAIISYDGQVDVYVRRNKSSISVKQIRPELRS